MKEVKEEHIYSDELGDIIGTPPPSSIIVGYLIIVLIFFAAILVSYFVRYPEVVSSDVVLITENPRSEIISKSTGRISFLITDGENVKKGQKLGIIENSANWEDVEYLNTILKQYNTNNLNELLKDTISVRENLKLGEIEEYFQLFIRSKREYKIFLSSNISKIRSTGIIKEIDNLNNLNKNIAHQIEIEKYKFEVVRQKFEIEKELYYKKNIHKLEFLNSQDEFLNSQQSIKSYENSLLNNKLQVEELKGRINDLSANNLKDIETLMGSYQDALNKLNASVKQWELNYLLISPIHGHASFVKQWKNNQNVTIGDEVMTILPKDERITAIGIINFMDIGKVKVSQKVNLFFESYPNEEYGHIEGKVNKITEVPSQGFYRVEISIPSKLVTSNKYEIEFKHELRAKGEIITRELRLIERFFYKIKELLNHRTNEMRIKNELIKNEHRK